MGSSDYSELGKLVGGCIEQRCQKETGPETFFCLECFTSNEVNQILKD